MKRILFIISVVALVIPLIAGMSFGATISASATSGNIESSGNPSCTLSLSKNVSFGYTPNAATNAQTYAIQSYHTSGDKDYGTASDTTLMYWQVDETKDDVGAPTQSDSTEFNGWTSM